MRGSPGALAPRQPAECERAGHEGAGKEVVLQFNSQLRSGGTFFTDSNGREMIKRQRNARGPSYPPYQIGEPVAGNY